MTARRVGNSPVVDLVDPAVEPRVLAESAAQEPGRGDHRPACGGQRDVVVERGRAQVAQLAGGDGPVAGEGLAGDLGGSVKQHQHDGHGTVR